MPILDSLPDQIENTLQDSEHALTVVRASALEDSEHLGQLLALETDLTLDGRFGKEWLVAQEDRLAVFAPNGNTKAKLLRSIPLSEVKKANADTMVGNGVIEVETATETIPLLRFTQANVGAASQIARQISSLAKGETPKSSTEKEKERNCKNCGRVLPEDSEVCPACLNRRATLLRLFKFLAPYKGRVIASLVLLVVVTVLNLAPPLLVGKMVDALSRKPNQPFPPPGGMETLFGLVGLLAVAKIGEAFIVYAQRRLNPYLGGRVTMDIRVALFNKFNDLSLSYFDKRSTGSLMARVTNDADNLWDFVSEGVPFLVSNVLMFVGIGAVLFSMNWKLALVMLTPGPLILLMTRWFMPRARERFRRVWHRISKMYSMLNSTLTGMRVVKAFAQEGRETGNFEGRNQAVFEASYAANAFWAGYWSLLSFLMSLGSYIVWLYGGGQVLGGVMTVGMLTAFNGYLWMFYQPFQNFSRVVDWSTRSLTAAERVFEVLDTEPDIRQSEKAISAPKLRGEVEFQDVGFTYDKAKRVLDDFSLKVNPGEMIGLVGHSGAGKSTIINLLSRFYDVTEGKILIDGIDIRDIDREDFRGQLGIVLQEPFLFPGTIRDNIAYAKPNATDLEVFRASKAANCHEFILKFPDGYDTYVGERGQRLSGGERQRISIARAILHDPKILILDEATASVDTETEKLIQEAINRLVEGRTTFAIAHRLSTLRHANRLVVMKEGKMVEFGSHDELMEIENGEYAKLVKIQMEVNQLRAL